MSKSKFFIITLGLVLIVFIVIYIGLIKLANNCNNLKNKYNKQIDLTTLNEQNIIYWINYFELKEPDIVLAQIKLETGYLNSNICISKNNLFGLMKNRTEYYEFKHWIQSIAFYKYRIQNRIKPNEDYYKFLLRINYADDGFYIKKLKQINNK